MFWRTAQTPVDARVPGIIALIAGSVALIFWLLSMRRARRLTKLRKIGLPTPASVTGHTKTGNKKTSAPIYRADWPTVNGLEGHTPPLLRNRLPPVGEKIAILVDPTGQLGAVWDAEV